MFKVIHGQIQMSFCLADDLISNATVEDDARFCIWCHVNSQIELDFGKIPSSINDGFSQFCIGCETYKLSRCHVGTYIQWQRKNRPALGLKFRVYGQVLPISSNVDVSGAVHLSEKESIIRGRSIHQLNGHGLGINSKIEVPLLEIIMQHSSIESGFLAGFVC